ncbi:MAG TPA: hypothetical protein DEP84_03735, partial [Chloroflexi bacterium]|nr:hypothetical protein [Chloroflexota bacterium]
MNGQTCPACGEVNGLALRVCRRCAAPLANVCSQCGFENPAGFKFCGNCGANLTVLQPPAVEADPTWNRLRTLVPEHVAQGVLAHRADHHPVRREVTVLFADFQGYTTLSEHCDPEDLYRILNRCQTAFVEAIYAHDGTIDKFTGDGLMALFGASRALENHAERACRVALAMQAAVADLSGEEAARLGQPLRLRIGINTGEVIVGAIGAAHRADYTVIGDTVNIAARLESLADGGAVLVSQSVYTPTVALCEYATLGSVTVKGRREPVEVYQLLGLREQPGLVRGLAGLRVPLVGREREMSVLMAARDRLLAGEGQVVLLSGEAGLGKSRLTAEFRASLPPGRTRVLEGACLSYRQPISYWPFISIVRQLLEINEEDSAATINQRLVTTLSELGLDADDVAPFVAHLLTPGFERFGDDDRLRYLAPAQLRQQLFLALRALFGAAARRQPLILIFEDLHWVDAPSLDLLLFLLEAVDEVPLMLYGISRPQEGEALGRLEQAAGALHGERRTALRLKPLAADESVTLFDALLSSPDVPPALTAKIRERAEGNPFYLEELIRMLIDRGVLRSDGQRWRLAPGLDPASLAEMPSSLHALLLARVDRLPADARRVLELASVIGRSFTLPLLQRLAQLEAPGVAFSPAFQRLEEAALVRRWQSPTGEGMEHVFRHVLMRDTVYGELLRERRRLLHRRVAEAIEALYKDRLEGQVELLAHHYLEGQAADRALPYLIQAGQRAAARFDNAQALKFFNTAYELLDQTGATTRQRIDLFAALGDVLTLTGDYDGGQTAYERALAVIGTGGESGLHRLGADLHRRLGRTFEKRSDYDEALRWYSLALAELELEGNHAGDGVERSRIYNDLGWVFHRKGDLERSQSWAARSLELLEGTENYQDMAAAYSRLIALHSQRGDWAPASEYARRSLEIRRRIGFSAGLYATYNNLSGLSIIQGDWPAATEYAEEALALSRRMGYRAGEGASLNNLAFLQLLSGRFEECRQILANSIAIGRALNDATILLNALNNQAQLEILTGEPETALAVVEESLTMAHTAGARELEAESHWLLAEALCSAGRSAEALGAAHRAIVLAGDLDSQINLGIARRTLARCALAAGDLDEAEDQLGRSARIFDRFHHPYEQART